METTTARLPAEIFPAPGSRTVVTSPVVRGTRRALASLATGAHRLLMAQAAPTLQAYGRRHGWDVILSSETLDPSRPPSWFKIKLVRELLAEYEQVFWIDADAIVVDLDRDVAAEVDPDADIWFARHPQDRDQAAAVLNAGVFLARATSWTVDLLDAVWRNEAYVEHNWWENAALLDLLGHSLEPPYEPVRESPWNERIGVLPLDWNSVPGYCEGPRPALNHHARSDHGDFERRLEDIARDRREVVQRFADDFSGQWSNSTAPIVRRAARTHEFTELALAAQPSAAELVTLVERLDALNEDQRLRLMEVFDWCESAVHEQVDAEFDAASCRQQLAEANAEIDRLRPIAAAAARTPTARVKARLRPMAVRMGIRHD